jgi:type II secretion system protein H
MLAVVEERKREVGAMVKEALRNQRGFTLIELLIVGAVITILAAVSVPAIRSFQKSTGLRGEAKQLVADLWQARQRAIASSTPFSLSFDPDGNSYTLYRDDGGGTPANAANGTLDSGEEVIGVKTFEGGYGLYDIDLDPANAVTFAPRGMLQSGTTGGYICLAENGSKYHTVYIRPSGLCRSESGSPASE